MAGRNHTKKGRDDGFWRRVALALGCVPVYVMARDDRFDAPSEVGLRSGRQENAASIPSGKSPSMNYLADISSSSRPLGIPSWRSANQSRLTVYGSNRIVPHHGANNPGQTQLQQQQSSVHGRQQDSSPLLPSSQPPSASQQAAAATSGSPLSPSTSAVQSDPAPRTSMPRYSLDVNNLRAAYRSIELPEKLQDPSLPSADQPFGLLPCNQTPTDPRRMTRKWSSVKEVRSREEDCACSEAPRRTVLRETWTTEQPEARQQQQESGSTAAAAATAAAADGSSRGGSGHRSHSPLLETKATGSASEVVMRAETIEEAEFMDTDEDDNNNTEEGTPVAGDDEAAVQQAAAASEALAAAVVSAIAEAGLACIEEAASDGSGEDVDKEVQKRDLRPPPLLLPRVQDPNARSQSATGEGPSRSGSSSSSRLDPPLPTASPVALGAIAEDVATPSGLFAGGSSYLGGGVGGGSKVVREGWGPPSGRQAPGAAAMSSSDNPCSNAGSPSLAPVGSSGSLAQQRLQQQLQQQQQQQLHPRFQRYQQQQQLQPQQLLLSQPLADTAASGGSRLGARPDSRGPSFTTGARVAPLARYASTLFAAALPDGAASPAAAAASPARGRERHMSLLGLLGRQPSVIVPENNSGYYMPAPTWFDVSTSVRAAVAASPNAASLLPQASPNTAAFVNLAPTPAAAPPPSNRMFGSRKFVSMGPRRGAVAPAGCAASEVGLGVGAVARTSSVTTGVAGGSWLSGF